jgi:outer membrane lipoprotein-sorting protein
MTRRVGLLLVVGVVCAFAVHAVRAEDLPAVEKQIADAWAKHHSMTAKINMTTSMDAGDSKVEGKGEGMMEFMRKGDKLYLRQELKNTMSQPGAPDSKMAHSMLIVVDGEHAWQLSEMMGQKTAVKTNIDPRMMAEPKAFFAELSKDNELKLLPDETVDGKKCYVIEVAPKEKSAGGMFKTIYYFDRDSGFVVKTVMVTADNKPTMTSIYSDIKYDTDIPMDRFVFKAPPGIDVQDMTKTELPKGETPAAPAKPEKPEKPAKP